MGLSQCTLASGLYLSQSTLGGGFGPQPEYSGRGFRASARVLWEGVLGLIQSTLGRGFGPEPEYSGRTFWASARVLWETQAKIKIDCRVPHFDFIVGPKLNELKYKGKAQLSMVLLSQKTHYIWLSGDPFSP